MGVFRRSTRKKTDESNEVFGSPPLADNTQKGGAISSPFNHTGRGMNGLFRLRKSRSSNWSSNKSIGDMTPSTVRSTPPALPSGTLIHITKQTPSDYESERYTQQTIEDTSATSVSSMLETLKILAVDDEQCLSPARSNTSSNIEVMTPESRQLLLQQREVIRKILFEKNQENHVKDVQMTIQNYDSEVDESTDEDIEDDNNRPESPPPPPPPLDIPEEDYHLYTAANVMASLSSQEVSIEGLVKNAMNDEIENELSTDAKVNRDPPGVEYNQEIHDLKISSERGRSVPISVDLSYTESDLASIISKKKEPAGYYLNENPNSKYRISLGTSNPSSESGMPSTGPADTLDGSSEVVNDLRDGASRGSLVVTPDIPNNKINKNRRSYILPNFLRDLKLSSSTYPSAPQVSPNNSPNEMAEVGKTQRSSVGQNQPDDEVHYDATLKKGTESPIPDDEEMEYSKDEILEIIRNNSAGTTLNIVDVRRRPLAPGGPSGPSEISVANGTAATAIHAETGHETKVVRHNDIVVHDEVREWSQGRDLVLSEAANDDDVYNDSDSVASGGNKHGSNDSIDYPMKNVKINNQSAYLCNSTDPGAVAQNILIALDCVSGINQVRDEKPQDEITQQLQEKVTKRQWNVSPKMTLSYGADTNSVVVSKVPSFFYSREDEVTSRFIRRITNYGFVLLHLQAPGSLGNQTEDWNGRTVTLTIEKGVLPASPKKSTSSASGCSSVTFSIKSNQTSGNNTLSTSKTLTPPIVKHPRVQWMTVAGGATTDVATTSVDLLNIQAISSFGNDADKMKSSQDETKSASNDEELCFFTITTAEGVVHMFEAASPEERNRIVEGLKSVVARLSFHLISGNPEATSELYCNVAGASDATPTRKTNEIQQKRGNLSPKPVLSELSRTTDGLLSERVDSYNLNAPVLANPSETMNRVAHVFLDV